MFTLFTNNNNRLHARDSCRKQSSVIYVAACNVMWRDRIIVPIVKLRAQATTPDPAYRRRDPFCGATEQWSERLCWQRLPQNRLQWSLECTTKTMAPSRSL